MQTEALFAHSKALDDAPAFRNINQRPGADAFDDLLDPADAAHDSQATLLALRKADSVRSNVSPFAVLDPATHYSLAIQRTFQRAVFYPTRYGDGSYPVWYGSLDQLTTIHETAFHMIRQELDLINHHKAIERRRIVYRVACTAILIDLTRESRFLPRLTDPTGYGFTQPIGKRIRTEMHPGLLAPSARHAGGINLAIFTSRVLSNPELIQHLRYRLDPVSQRLTVIDETDGKEIAAMDGRLWL